MEGEYIKAEEVAKPGSEPGSESEYKWAVVIYALLAAGFVTVVTWLVAIVLVYVKIDAVRGSWLESHFLWQMRTFWYGLLWSILGGILLLVLVGHAVLLAVTVWVIYRIVKGWLYLYERKPVYSYRQNS